MKNEDPEEGRKIASELSSGLDTFSDMCLRDAGRHRGYSDRDLMNASIVFTHFLCDKIYSENRDSLPMEGLTELVSSAGKAVHAVILSSTGKDMKEIAKSL